MERRSKFLTFVLALIPGAGQIYLGLTMKGIQLFALYVLIRPALDIIGLGYIGGMLKIIIWVYAFFDTFEVARRIDRGERVGDSEFVFKKYMENNDKFDHIGRSFNKNFWLLCGWGLIAVGILAILNLTFGSNDLYGLIKSYVSTYFIPVILVIAGFYMLVKNKR